MEVAIEAVVDGLLRLKSEQEASRLSTLARAAEKAGFAAAKIETAFVIDPASWAFSFQNRLRARATAGVAQGTAWYALASLPLWAPLALAERLAGRGGSIVMAASS